MNYGVQSNDYAPARAARDKSYFGVRYIKRNRRRDETEGRSQTGPLYELHFFVFNLKLNRSYQIGAEKGGVV